MSKNQKIVFAIIILFAAFLIFFRLGRQDMLGDDAHYSMRAYGYFDYMASQKQTTPLQWFGDRPGWSYLSFHDHPPMYFFGQHIFFKLFGDSVEAARLTSALAAFGSVVIMYFLGKRLSSARLGLIAAAALILNNYFIWNGRIGHIESLLIFWFLLSLLYLVKAMQDDPKYYLWAGLFFGLALLTKVSMLFMLPAILLYLVWKERRVFRQKQFWLGLLIFLIVASPLFIYNLEMLKTRGHFDIQFADLFGQSNRDWPILASRTNGWHFAISDTLDYLISGMSWPYFLLILLSLPVAIGLGRRQPLWWLLGLLFVVTLFFLMYVGGASRWLSIVSPFAALLVAGLVEFAWPWRRAVLFGSAILSVYFLFYIFNSNHAIAASNNKYLTSTLRLENYGYNQLDDWVRDLLAKKSVPYRTRVATSFMWFEGINREALPFLKDKTEEGEFNSLLVYDSGVIWFPTIWTFGRARVYRGVPAMTSSEFVKFLQDEEGLKFLNYLGFEQIYYIQGGEEIRRQTDVDSSPEKLMQEAYEKQGVRPEVIRDLRGREAFYIYHAPEIHL